MFERYNEKARQSIFFARYEASVFASPYIEPHRTRGDRFRIGTLIDWSSEW
jgi:hypothetical protein